jgi:hypothetical protein
MIVMAGFVIGRARSGSREAVDAGVESNRGSTSRTQMAGSSMASQVNEGGLP